MTGRRALILAFSLFLTAVSTGMAGAGCGVARIAGANEAIPETRLNQKLLDAAILAQVNYYRCRNGLSELDGASGLRKVAEGHSKWMGKAQNLSHNSTVSGRRTLRDRLKRSGVSYRTGAENIGMFHFFQLDGRPFLIKDAAECRFTTYGGTPLTRHSYESLAKSAVAYWMASSKHRTNILNRDLRMMGTGAFVNRQGAYCGTIFMAQTFAG